MMKMTFNLQKDKFREVAAFCEYFVGECVESSDEKLLTESKNVLFLEVAKGIENFLELSRSSNKVFKITSKEDRSEFLCRIKIFPDDKDSALIELKEL